MYLLSVHPIAKNHDVVFGSLDVTFDSKPPPPKDVFRRFGANPSPPPSNTTSFMEEPVSQTFILHGKIFVKAKRIGLASQYALAYSQELGKGLVINGSMSSMDPIGFQNNELMNFIF